MQKRTLVLAALAALAAGVAASAPEPATAPLSYPPAVRGDVVDDYHGTAVADPYRWLEDLDSPATRGWVEAQAKLTQGYLSATPLRARLRQRLAALYDFAAFGTPFVAGGRYFYTLNSGRQDQ